MFDGKLGLWPFSEEYVGQRSSANQPAGTILQRNLLTVDLAVYKAFLLEHVIRAIKQKWLIAERDNFICIQQDNATPHVDFSDPDIRRACCQEI